jgi:H+-transporting ATPase
LNDRLKLLAYRIFDPVRARAPSAAVHDVAERAYELYVQEGRRDGHASEDWEKAEREIQSHSSRN